MSEENILEQAAELHKAVSSIIGAGYQIDKEAYDFLTEISQKVDLSMLVENVIEEAGRLQDRPLLISRELIEKGAKDSHPSKHPSTLLRETRKTRFRPYAKEVESDLRVLGDRTDKTNISGSIEDYMEHFRDRFRRLSKIMKSRMDVRDASSLRETFKAPKNSELKFVCMIMEKRESSRGIFLKVEDLDADATVFVPSENRDVFQKAQRLVLDQVVCIHAVKGRNNLLIAQDIIFPDVPSRKPNNAPVPVYAALLSDLHVGSRMFMKDSFQRFVLWLEGKIGNRRLRDIGGHIKYVIIAGDIVDGVGVYPRQIDDLEITDIYEQYKAAAKIIEQIPEYIEIVVIPGNHDAVRRPLPQPAIPKEYAESLYESPRIHLLGNPSTLSLHGVNVLVCHGRSLDDVISTVPQMIFKTPSEGMKFLLQCRHLAPAYGSRTLMASERVDHLVIENVPDIFHAGHVHVVDYTSYRGILIVNSGAWQKQTEYQREMGHVPSPGIAPIVNLQNLEMTPVSFELSM